MYFHSILRVSTLINIRSDKCILKVFQELGRSASGEHEERIRHT